MRYNNRTHGGVPASLPIFRLGAAAIFAVAAGFVLWIFLSDNPPDTATLVAGILAPIGLAPAVLYLWNKRWKGLIPPTATFESDLQTLGRRINDSWAPEAVRRGITVPATITVTWKLAGGEVLLDEAEGDHQLPLAILPTPISVGVLEDIDRILERSRKRRVIIEGPSGYGKTATLILLLLQALGSRKLAGPVAAARTPLLLTLSDWDPFAQPLRDWICEQVAGEHPGLFGCIPGGLNYAFQMDRISLFLDGFDEMRSDRRCEALQQISAEHSVPIILSSRPGQLEECLSLGDFEWWPRITLEPVKAEDGRAYLLTDQKPTKVATWEKVCSAWASGDAILGGALETPLMLNLARRSFAAENRNPITLLDRQRFPTAESLKESLVASILTLAYPIEMDLDSAREKLIWLARRMAQIGTRDIVWWRIRSWQFKLAHYWTLCSVYTLLCFTFVIRVDGKALSATSFSVAWFVAQILAGSAVLAWRLRPQGPWLHGMIPRLTVAGTLLVLFSLSIGFLIRLAANTHDTFVEMAAWGFVCGGLAGLVIAMVNLHDGYAFGAIRWPTSGDMSAGLVGACLCGLTLLTMVPASYAMALAATAGVAYTLAAAWVRPPTGQQELASPSQTMKADLRGSAALGVLGSVIVGLATTVLFIAKGEGIVESVGLALPLGILAGLACALTLSRMAASQIAWSLVFLRTPGLGGFLSSFLEDGNDRGIFRQAGNVFQFRHSELLDQLAKPSPSRI